VTYFHLVTTFATTLTSSFIGKRGTGDKGFVLTVQCEDHQNHQLAEDPFQFPAHLKSSEEYLEAHRQATKHREQVLPYSVSRRLIDAEDLGVALSSRDYYNSVRKQLPDKTNQRQSSPC